jgi:hypothetical protein
VPEVGHPGERAPGREQVPIEAAREAEADRVVRVVGYREALDVQVAELEAGARLEDAPLWAPREGLLDRPRRGGGCRFRLSIPLEWSLCSCVTKTASILSRDSPTAARSAPKRRAENPASSSIRAPSVTTRALLPELPLPKMQNLIAIREFSADAAASAMELAPP